MLEEKRMGARRNFLLIKYKFYKSNLWAQRREIPNFSPTFKTKPWGH